MRAVLALLMAVGMFSVAHAHAFLTHATPGVGDVVASAPKQVILSYTEGLEVPFCSVTVQAPDGSFVQTGKAEPVPGQAAEMAVGVKISAPGAYKVVWHAVSVDTHHTQGAFSFTYQP
jgi:methionine-rich copper-binding protein CopC